jgi:MFS family permease
VGTALLSVAVFGLLFPAVEFDAARELRWAFLVLPALAVLAGFVFWERGPAARRGYPLIDLGLFGIRSYAGGIVLAILFFCAYTGTPLVLALFLQDGLGFSALHSGLTASAYAVGVVLSAPVAGRLLPRLGQKVLIGALVLFGAGVAVAALVADLVAGTVAPAHVALLMAPALLVAGLGGGAVITPNQALSLAEVDVQGGSTAGGMLQTSQRIGNALGAAVISAVFYAAVSRSPAGGAGREAVFGHAYAMGLVVSVGFTAVALGVAIHGVRHAPRAGISDPAAGAQPAADAAPGRPTPRPPAPADPAR